MKKIMKKFLSSLLALTMILSLVIVPANADSTPSGSATPNVSGATGSNGAALVGDNLTFTLTNLSVTDDRGTVGETLTPNVTWSVGGQAIASNSYTVASTDNGTLSVTYSGTISYQLTTTTNDGTRASSTTNETVNISGRTSVTVSNPQADFSAAAKKITYQGREYSVPAGATPSVTIDKFVGDPDFSASTLNVNVTGYTIDSRNVSYSGSTLTVKAGSNASDPSVAITVNPTTVSGQTLTIDKGNSITLYEGQQVELTATYSRANGNKNVSYAWTSNPDATFRNDTSATATFKAPTSVSSDTNYTVTCTVKEGDTTAKTANITITVKDDPYSPNRNGESSSKSIATNGLTNYCTFSAPILYSSTASTHSISYGTSGFDIAWAVKSGDTFVKTQKQDNGSCKVTALTAAKSGTATITATITYLGKEYSALEYTVDVTSLDVELSSITNGDSDEYNQSALESKLATAINKVTPSTFTSSDISHVYVTGIPSRVTLKDGSTSMTAGKEVTSGLDIYADEGYIGDGSFQLRVVAKDGSSYNVILYVPITGDKDIKDTVTGTSANKSVTFTNSDYDYLYIYEDSSFKTEKYDGDWSKPSTAPKGWKPVAQNKDYTVSSSAFDKNGKATLYVVAVDDKIASTGTITVSQKSYDINYNVVAGKSVTFNQKDFESFLEDYAEDNGNYNPKKDEITFDHATLNSLPTAKSEGTLYYGGSEVTSTSNRKAEYTDMDKMTFEAIAKPTKDT